MEDISVQLNNQKRLVDFKTYDISVKEIISMVNEKIINIAPDYQRKFRWDNHKQSQLVESLFLGIPVPSLFMATNSDSSWEVIDGLQRLSTLIRYASETDSYSRKLLVDQEPLVLEGLEKLSSMNGKTISELPFSLKLDFLLKPLKIITLSDKSDEQVRFDLFQRLNTGGITLTDQEIRNCVYRGPLNDLIKSLSEDQRLKAITIKPKNAKDDGTYEELVLRFFAYLFGRNLFEHNVRDFLNIFMKNYKSSYNEKEYREIFDKVFEQLSHLEHGIVKSPTRRTSSTVFWEAVTVGAAEAILNGVDTLFTDDFYEWSSSDEFNRLVTGATNSRPMIDERIRFTKEKFSRINV